MRDIYSNVLVKASLKPAVRTASANGTAVDRAEDDRLFQDAMVVVTTGTVTDGTHTFTIEDSDDGSSWATVGASGLEGDNPVAVTSANDETVYETRYTGGKRYLRVVATVAGASTGGLYSALVILSNARSTPAVRP